MATEKNKAIDEAQIRQLIDGWTKALRAKDIKEVMSNYVPEILVFDIAPPLLYRGADAYRKNYEEWFASWQGPIGCDIRDLSTTVGDGVAFSHSLNRIYGKRTNGEETDVWVRVTACFRKINGKWLIAHEYISVPLYMDGSDRAALTSSRNNLIACVVTALRDPEPAQGVGRRPSLDVVLTRHFVKSEGSDYI